MLTKSVHWAGLVFSLTPSTRRNSLLPVTFHTYRCGSLNCGEEAADSGCKSKHTQAGGALARVLYEKGVCISHSALSDSSATPWAVAHRAGSGLLFPPPGALPDPGMELVSCIAFRFFTVWAPSDQKGRAWSYFASHNREDKWCTCLAEQPMSSCSFPADVSKKGLMDYPPSQPL